MIPCGVQSDELLTLFIANLQIPDDRLILPGTPRQFLIHTKFLVEIFRLISSGERVARIRQEIASAGILVQLHSRFKLTVALRARRLDEKLALSAVSSGPQPVRGPLRASEAVVPANSFIRQSLSHTAQTSKPVSTI